MNRSKAIVLGLMTLVACASLGFVFWPAPAGDPEGAGARRGALARGASPGKQLLTIPELYRAGWAKARPGDAPGAAADPGLDGRIAELLASDPQLQKFYNLRRKALRTSTEQQDYLGMIADARLIAEARQDLLSAASGLELDQENELRRLQRIQYLNSALAWADNPRRAEVVRTVTDVLLAEVPRAAPSSAKGSMLGDKLDLFQILMMSDRAEAEALLTRARGTPLEKVFELAWSTGAPPREAAVP